MTMFAVLLRLLRIVTVSVAISFCDSRVRS